MSFSHIQGYHWYRQVPLFGVPLIGSFRRNQKKIWKKQNLTEIFKIIFSWRKTLIWTEYHSSSSSFLLFYLSDSFWTVQELQQRRHLLLLFVIGTKNFVPIFFPVVEGRRRHRLAEFGKVEFFYDFVQFLQLNDTFAIFSFSFERNIDSTTSKLFLWKKFSLAHFQKKIKTNKNTL